MVELSDVFESPWPALRPYKPAFPRPVASDKLVAQLYVYGTGLEVSLCRFFEDRIVQHEVRYYFL